MGFRKGHLKQELSIQVYFSIKGEIFYKTSITVYNTKFSYFNNAPDCSGVHKLPTILCNIPHKSGVYTLHTTHCSAVYKLPTILCNTTHCSAVHKLPTILCNVEATECLVKFLIGGRV